MKKGRFGIVFSFYAILAFILVILKMPLLGALLFGFVTLAERDEWLGRQTLQAFLMSAVVVFLGKLFSWINSLIPGYFFFSGALNVITSLLSVLVYAAAIVFSILAILRVMKEEEANVPLFAEIAYKAYGTTKPRPVPPIPGPYPPPYGQQNPQGGPGGMPPQQGSYPPPPYGIPQQQPWAGQQPPVPPVSPTPPGNNGGQQQ